MMEENNFIVCPNCGKIHKITKKDGGLRMTIFCKCKDDHHHTKIWWVHGLGYHVINSEGDLVEVF